jgi:hypothetical protein
MSGIISTYYATIDRSVSESDKSAKFSTNRDAIESTFKSTKLISIRETYRSAE